MLAITRRPSATTPGMVANLPSSSTSCATARVAAAPEPIATPMSASFSASASFTPSPVIATTWPRDCSAPTIARFCCGRDATEHRVRLEHVGECRPGPRAARGRRRPSPAPGSSTRCATAATVRGLSPEITLSVTPCSWKYRSVSAASGRIFSANITSATGLETRRAASRRRAARRRARARARGGRSPRARRLARAAGRRGSRRAAPSRARPSPRALAVEARRAPLAGRRERHRARARSSPRGRRTSPPAPPSVALRFSSSASAPSAAATASTVTVRRAARARRTRSRPR